ncbi:MAG: alpha-amylase [Parasporobacterium sp.]|nr:alpha-amylase [Parasporobacterium sp.]
MADQTKKELRQLMMYQIFVRNYSREGTFAMVERDLERIRSLGTDIIYFLPIHPIGEKNRKGSLGSPYAIRDYRAINPEYGTLEDFRRLVESIHAHGMKCIIDIVYNHTAPDSELVMHHPEWFYHREDGSFGNRVGEWTDIIDLDYAQKGLWEYQIDTLKFWAEIVDGFRCDVAPMVPIAFWERARREVEVVRPGLLWLAESIHPEFLTELRSRGLTAHSDGEIFRAFDVSYDYDIYGEWENYLCGRSGLSGYLEALRRQEWIYPDNYIKLRFLENHDQPRVRFLVSDEKMLRNITAFSFFQKGMAFIYAGQEFGASHLPSLFDRDTVCLSPEKGTDLSMLIRQLSALKKSSIFTDSSYQVQCNCRDICVAVHTRQEQMAVGVFSLRGESGTVQVPLADGNYQNELDRKQIEVIHGLLHCSGEPVWIQTPEEEKRPAVLPGE